jgi:thiol-disulfide isomerase/thioredoxin
LEAFVTRTLAALFAVGGILFAGCSDPELQKRVDELEQKVATLEARPAAPGAAAPANAEDEQAAANLLKEASQAAEKMEYDSAKAKLAELNSKYGATRAARAAQRLQAELDIVGKDAVALDVDKWFQGQVADVNAGGATLLVFWEVWCPHCKREVPNLTETYNKYNSKGLQMVGLTKMTRDVTEDQVTSFLKDNSVAYPIAKEKGDAMSQHYGVRGIPAAAVVKDGKVVWRGHPARLTDDMIESWL